MNGIDFEKLAAAVNRKLTNENISIAEAVREINVSRSTLWSVRHAKRQCETHILLSVCRWLNVPFERFTTGEPERVVFYEESETLDKIEASIAADWNLEESDRRKLIEIFRSQYQIITNLGK